MGGGDQIEVSQAKVYVEPLIDQPCLTPTPPKSYGNATTVLDEGRNHSGWA